MASFLPLIPWTRPPNTSVQQMNNSSNNGIQATLSTHGSDVSSESWNAKYSIWEYVHCGVCLLPFVNPRNPNAPPPVPFWLTECSHVVCNNHLNVDQTCRQCKTGEPVELMPLQRELPDPMGRWFQNMPTALEDMIGSVKFQHETMANLIRFYKSKCLSQKELIDRLRRELDSLKAGGNQISHANENVHDHGGNVEHDEFNSNGKRRRVEHTAPTRENEPPHRRTSAFMPGLRPSRLTLRPPSAQQGTTTKAKSKKPSRICISTRSPKP
ncbi:hypothetical protein CPB86DRAFT_237752 [Serendipita vermifera]|nr:hypothetical protein CPB86DRAFT_237752 [Serendipita vermifera]